MPRLTIALLGPMQVSLDGAPVTAFGYDKVRALLAFLAVEAARPHTRDALAELLWPDQPAQTARTSLRTALATLRRALATAEPLILARRDDLQLAPSPFWELDAALFSRFAQGCDAHTPTPSEHCANCANALRQAIACYRGPFLASLERVASPPFEDWALLRRERLQRTLTLALARLAAFHERTGDLAAALVLTDRQLDLDPWAEPAHRARMRLLAAIGQRADALRHYERARHLLLRDLNAHPEPETTALYEKLRAAQGGGDKETRRQGDKETRRQGDKQTAAPDASGSRTEASPLSRERSEHLPLSLSPPLSLSRERSEHLPLSLSPPLPLSRERSEHLPRFYGRAPELATLRGWIADEGCRIVAILGIGGVGKTALAAELARELAASFEAVLWCSALNAPPLDETLGGWLRSLAYGASQPLPDSSDARLALLMSALRKRRCLLVLDNLESLLQPAGRVGAFRPEHADYARLLEALAQSQHSSCLLLTSRENPLVLARLEAASPAVRSLTLAGLPQTAGRAILHEQSLQGSEAQSDALIARYSGNPLALRIVAATIRDLFGGDVDAFLRDEAPIFDDIRGVLDQQWARLAPLERELLTWLAVLREPTTVAALHKSLAYGAPLRDVIEAARALARRSLLQQHSGSFTLQNVITEYVTDRLVAGAVAELECGQIEVLARHALMQAQAQEYVRQTQKRLILAPVFEQLAARLKPEAIHALFRGLLDVMRAWSRPAAYAPGNILNLLLHAYYDVSGYDFSRLCVWQADARGARLPNVNLSDANLTGSAFNDAFRSIHAIAWSPDGALLAGGTSDGAVAIWRVADGALTATFPGHNGFVWSIAWSPDGALLASSGGDHTVFLWHIASDTHQALHGQGDMISELAFSPDGATLAGGSYDRAIYLWDVRSAQLRHTLLGHNAIVLALAWRSDGRQLLSASGDRELRVWEAASGTCVCAFTSPTAGATAVAWCHNDTLIVACGPLQPMHVWDGQTLALLDTVSGPAGFGELAVSPDGSSVALGGPSRGVFIWNAAEHRIASALIDTAPEVSGNLAWHPAGHILALPSANSTVQIWDTRTAQLLRNFWGYNGWVYTVAWRPDGAILAAGTHAQQIALWNAASRHTLHDLEWQVGWILSLAWSPDGAILAIGSRDGGVRLWNLHAGQAPSTLARHPDAVECVAWSPDGRRIASASRDCTVRVSESQTGQPLLVGAHHSAPVISVAWSPDGQWLASGGRDKTVQVWNSRSGEVVASFAEHNAGVLSVAWSPTGQWLASGGNDGVVRVWNPRSGAPLNALAGHATTVTSVAWSPDGQWLASASNDQTVRVWNVARATCRLILRGHTGWIRAVAWSPNGQWLASGSYDETFKVWNATTGECIATVRCARPYEGARIAGVAGITPSQRAALVALGAVT